MISISIIRQVSQVIIKPNLKIILFFSQFKYLRKRFECILNETMASEWHFSGKSFKDDNLNWKCILKWRVLLIWKKKEGMIRLHVKYSSSLTLNYLWFPRHSRYIFLVGGGSGFHWSIMHCTHHEDDLILKSICLSKNRWHGDLIVINLSNFELK